MVEHWGFWTDSGKFIGATEVSQQAALEIGRNNEHRFGPDWCVHFINDYSLKSN